MRSSWSIAALAALSLAAAPAEPDETAPANAKPDAATPAILSGPRPVVATARVDKAIATTGDVIAYTVTLEHDVGYQVELPEPGADIAGLRIIDIGRDDPETRDGKVIDRWWYTLRADLVGTYILPPLRSRYRKSGTDEWQTLTTSQIFIEVESVLPADGEVTDIRDIKPLIVPERGPPWWLIGIGVALLLAAIVLVIWITRTKATASVPPPPPYEIAFAALDALRQTDFTDIEAVRDYYFRISEVLRAYIEGTFSLNATDLTTEEILPRLTELDELQPPQRVDLRLFLQHTDRVKFAEHHPTSSEVEQAYEHALGFVEATVPNPNARGEA